MKRGINHSPPTCWLVLACAALPAIALIKTFRLWKGISASTKQAGAQVLSQAGASSSR